MKSFFRTTYLILTAFIFCFLISSCASSRKSNPDFSLPYRKVLKSKDLDLKFKYANFYLLEGDCQKALPIYEELIPAFRLTDKGATAYYNYAECYYCLKDYYMAGYYYKNFAKNNPSHSLSENALFYSALCHVKTSPEFELDQDETKKAISELQIFIDFYPESKKVDTCNLIMDKLLAKLEEKNYQVAKQYLKTENYKAATVAFKAFLEEHPATKYREEITFLQLKSSYLLAQNSIDSKKTVRLKQVLDFYTNFVAAFPESRYKKDADGYRKNAEKMLEGLNKLTDNK